MATQDQLGFTRIHGIEDIEGKWVRHEDALQSEPLKKSEWQLEVIEIQQHLIDTRNWLLQLRSEFNDHVNKGG